jgi:lipid-A-disaccharide synthase
MRYYIIAGEASGDLHASNLMKEIRKLDPDSEFRFWGGDMMLSQGGELVKHYRDNAYMGFFEVAANLGTILANIRFCKKDLLAYHPDVLILVDYPGFNLRIAKYAKSIGVKVFYYISPQLWAWKPSRHKIIKKYVDRMFVILPFEKEFYEEYNYEVDYIGHPLLDVINEKEQGADRQTFIEKNKLPNKPIIALLPGSRKQEVGNMLRTMLTVVPTYKKYQFIIAGATSIQQEFYNRIISNYPVKIIFNQTYDLLKHADAALVTSGTATLETALLGTPQVVCYKGNFLSYIIARRIVKVKFISLVNLIMNREVVKELIQKKFTEVFLAYHLKTILEDTAARDRILYSYKTLRDRLGGQGASGRAAKLMIHYLRESDSTINQG